jgi:7-carboxy-7-deazaguanine synthase
MNYKINDIYPCIQGEGVHTGVPMILIRLHGCSVGCTWCDTRETWNSIEENRTTLAEAMGTNEKWATTDAEEIIAYISAQYQALRWILLTGGEPADQELVPLASAFKQAGYKIAIETSGTATGHLEADIDWICVSPKFDMPGGKEIIAVCLETAHEIKHVVGKQAHIERLEQALNSVRLRDEVIINLQPVSLSKKATQLCIETVIKRGWRLSLQTHKFIEQR